jgi:hypothetical protein
MDYDSAEKIASIYERARQTSSQKAPPILARLLATLGRMPSKKELSDNLEVGEGTATD